MSIFNFPHIFKDGVGETASGAQVDENLEAIRTYLEEHQRHSFLTPGGTGAGSVVNGSEQTVTTPAETQISWEAMLTATWNSSTEGGYIVKLERDGVVVTEEALSVSAGKAVAGYWVGHIRLDYLQATAGAHTWRVKLLGFGTEITFVLHKGVLTVVPS